MSDMFTHLALGMVLPYRRAAAAMTSGIILMRVKQLKNRAAGKKQQHQHCNKSQAVLPVKHPHIIHCNKIAFFISIIKKTCLYLCHILV